MSDKNHKIMTRPLPEILDEIDATLSRLEAAEKAANQAAFLAAEAAAEARAAGLEAAKAVQQAVEKAIKAATDDLLRLLEDLTDEWHRQALKLETLDDIVVTIADELAKKAEGKVSIDTDFAATVRAKLLAAGYSVKE